MLEFRHWPAPMDGRGNQSNNGGQTVTDAMEQSIRQERRLKPELQRGSFIDPAALMRIKNLQLRARVVVDGYLSGMHRSPVHGFTVEFTEYRHYTPGDDL